MKKTISIVLCLLLVLLMVGCAKEDIGKVKRINKNGIQFTVDTENHTIEDGSLTYSYAINGSEIVIRYPDGQTYTWKESNGIGTGSTSLDFDYSTHMEPSTLLSVIEDAHNTSSKTTHKNTGVGIILLLIGAVYAVWPKKLWFISWGWRYKNAEPSDLAIGVFRVVGVIVGIIGLIIIIT